MKKLVNGIEIECSKEEEKAILDEWKASDEYAKQVEYKGLRRREYGKITDQLDFIVHNGIDAFIERNKAIKDKYPKPE